MKIILLGAPGAGKGTQASRIAGKYKLLHISTGDIFRANIKNGTEIGKIAKSYTDSGRLVPDEVTCEIVKDRLSWKDAGQGYMLDGFPRNLFQAQQLDKFADIDICLNIDVDESLLMDRICGRVCARAVKAITFPRFRAVKPAQSAEVSCTSVPTTFPKRSKQGFRPISRRLRLLSSTTNLRVSFIA